MSAPKLLALVVLLACSSGEGATPGDGGIQVTTGGNLKLTVDGTTRMGNAVIARSGAGMATVFNSVAASFPDGQTVSMSWTGTAPGNIGPKAGQLILTWIDAGRAHTCGDGVAGSDCTLVLSSYDQQRVAGTFSGTLALAKGPGAATVAITGGTFEVRP